MNRFVSYFVVFIAGFLVCFWTIYHFYGSPANFRAENGGSVYHGVSKEVGTNIVSQAADEVSKFVVNIDTIGKPVANNDPFGFFFGEPAPSKGQGSGVIFTPDGYILTNNHVVQDAEKMTVTLKNNKQYQAKLIGRDTRTDLAVIKIDASGLEYAQFADSTTARVGDQVIAVGSPFGYKWTVTAGIISGLGRQLGGPERLIQTDAAINFGNSGGALADLAGKVVGINRIIVSPSGGNIGLGFAIPSNTARRIANELKERGKVVHPWVGIVYVPLNVERSNLEASGVKNLPSGGVLVKEVVKNSPAEQSGLQAQDVITKFGGKPLSGDVEPQKGEYILGDLVEKTRVGERIDAEIWHSRTGQSGTIAIRIGEMPPNYGEQQPSGPVGP